VILSFLLVVAYNIATKALSKVLREVQYQRQFELSHSVPVFLLCMKLTQLAVNACREEVARLKLFVGICW
jgi:hypothetical protein